MHGKMRARLVGGLVATLAVAGLAMPASAQAASWKTLDTYRTSFTCAGAKASLELRTPWVLRCQKAGTFTYYLQRYS